MKTFQNDFVIDDDAECIPQDLHRNVEINKINYRMGDEIAGLTHAIVLLIDAVDRNTESIKK